MSADPGGVLIDDLLVDGVVIEGDRSAFRPLEIPEAEADLLAGSETRDESPENRVTDDGDATSANGTSPGPNVEARYLSVPLSFEENVGQTDTSVDFLARGDGYAVFLTGGDAVLAVDGPAGRDVFRLELVGADHVAEVRGSERLSGTSNYFLGTDQESWRTGVANFGAVEYAGVYDGIDLQYHGNQRQLEYDFVLRPGADPDAIRLQFDGAESVRIADNGDLVLTVGAQENEVRFRAPLSYQEGHDGREVVESRYFLHKDSTVGFELGAYDSSRELVIDPVLDYGTYVGGTGSERAYAVAADSSGSAYITGYTQSADFPTASAYDATHNSGLDLYVTKLSADGSSLEYSTFIGGGDDDEGRGIYVDASGAAYVTGTTRSSDFPLTAGVADATFEAISEAFAVKLNADGDTLVYSTFIGGDNMDQANAIVADASGNAYVAGETRSPANFPTTAGALDTTYSGTSDGFLVKLNATATAFEYATFLGGSSSDYISGLAVDGSGNAYVTGLTTSNNFATAGTPYDATYNSGEDAFLSQVNAAGSALVYSTYLGGSSDDYGNDVVLDGSGNIYLAAVARSSTFPTTVGAYDTSHGGNDDTVVMKFASDKSLTFSTFFGGAGFDRAIGIVVDSSGNIHIAGDVPSNTTLPTTPDAYQATTGGGSDSYLATFDSTGATLLYATYLGGSGTESNAGLAIDSADNLYLAGWGGSADFDVTAGAFDETANGNNDAYVVKFSALTAGMAVWAQSGSTTPQYNLWDGTSFGTEANSDNVGGYRILAGADAPTRDEKIVVGVDDGEVVSGELWDGTSWTAFSFNDLATVSDSFWWGFDVAYEQDSGDALLVYNNGSTGSTGLSYRTWDGSVWSSSSDITTPLSGEPKQLRLAADPNSDGMVLVASNATSQDYALVWDGSSWGNSQVLSSSGSGDDRTDVYVAYEEQSGEAVLVYGRGGTDALYRTWDGATWSTEGTIAAPGGVTGNVRWTTLASDPTSNRVALGALTFNNETWLSVWDGTSWEAATAATISAPSATVPGVAVAFESTSGEALATYGESASEVRYREWTSGGGWSAEQIGPSIGATPNSMMLDADPGSNQVMLSVQDSGEDLNYVLWDGDSWGTPDEQETATGETKNQPFLFLWDAGSGAAGNTAPSIALPAAALNYTEGDGAVVIDATATATDTDSADFDTGTLTVDFTANGSANDRLAIENVGTGVGEIGVSGSDVTYEGTTIGSFAGGTDGSTPLVVTLNASADATAVQVLLRNITYENVAVSPDATARTVRFVLTDGDGGTSTAETETINVNRLPTADAGGPYTISEGDDLVLDASSSSDPDPDTPTYQWDLDNDGNFAEVGEPTTVNPTVSWATLVTFGIDDDTGSPYTIGVRVDDGSGGIATATASVTVNNTAPMLTTAGASTVADGGLYTLNLGATDPGDDTISGWTIDWGDGTTESIVGNPAAATHTYAGAGNTYNILAAVTDEDGTFLQNELLVPSYITTDSLFRYQPSTGSFLEEFATSDGLVDPYEVIVGPDGNLYASGTGSNDVLRYDSSGTFIDQFVATASGGLDDPIGLTFGADGNLYVSSFNTNNVLRYDGSTGSFINIFASGGGLSGPTGLTFGTDGDLYVSGFDSDNVMQFDGATGAAIGEFVTSGSGGLDTPEDIAFGPDGNLYVTSPSSNDVLRYNGSTGAFIDSFASGGGLSGATGLAFSPDGHLYVSSYFTDEVLRYDATSGAFVDAFFAGGAGGLDGPTYLNFVPEQQVTINTEPTISLPGGALNYTENDGAVVIDATATASDVDSADFDTGTLTVDFTANSTASDRLAIQNVGTGVGEIGTSGSDVTYEGTTIGTFAGGTDGSTPLVVTLNASADATAVQALMRKITYENVSENPSESARTVRFVLTDGDGGTSVAATDTINVTAENDDPTDSGSLPTDVSVTEDVTTAVDLSSINVTDVDAGNNLLNMTLSTDTGGLLFASTDFDVIVSGTGTSTLTLIGGLADLNNFLDAPSHILYLHGTSHTNGDNADTIQVDINDNGNTGSGGSGTVTLGTVNVDITAVNDDPSITLPGAAVSYTEGDGAVVVDAAATATDVDLLDFDTGTLTVDFTANSTADDRLSFQNVGTGVGEIGVSGSDVTYEGTVIGTFAGGTDGTTPLVVTLNASADATAVQALMRNITYENVSANPSTAARTVRFVLTDGDTGTSSAVTETINVAVGPGITITASSVDSIGEQVEVSQLQADALGTYLSHAVAMDPEGNTVVVWTSDAAADGDGQTIMARRFDALGSPIGTEFVVNTTGTDHQSSASVAMDDAGNFAVAWASANQDGSGEGIYARLYDSNGTALTGELPVNTTTAGAQSDPSIAMDADGDFVIVWAGAGTGDTVGVFGQRFDSSGAAQSGEFLINQTTSNNQQFADVSMDRLGNFVVTWTSTNQDGSANGVYLRRYGNDGTARGPEELVNTNTTGSQWLSSVSSNASGAFAVAWRDDGQAGELFMQLYDSDGSKNGGEIQLPSAPTASANYPTVAMDDAGRVTAVWEDSVDADDYAIVARQFDATGAPLGAQFVVNTHEASYQEYPAIAMTGDGQFSVVWTDYDVGGSGEESIEMRRYGATSTEAGGTASFQVVLDTQPLADVTISLAMPDGTEGTLSTTSLTFTNADWSIAQAVTVTGLDDALADGDITHVLTVGPVVSADPNYSGLDAPDLRVANLDNDPSVDLDADDSAAAGVDFAATWTEDAGPVAITDVDAVVVDPDSTNLTSLTVTITNLLDGTDEVLAADTTGTSIAGSYDDATGILTLSGPDTVANYQQVLRTVTYDSANDTPDPTSRVITFVASDGVNTSLVATTTLSITPENDDPTIALPAAPLNYTEGDGAVVVDATATASDVDSADFDTGSLTVDFTANGSADDRLAIQNVGTGLGEIGVSGSNVSYEGTTIGTFSGGSDGTTPLVVTLGASADVSAVQELLRNITYENVSEDPSTAARTVRFVLTDGDGGTSSAITETINVAAQNDDPAIALPAGAVNYTEGDGAVVIDATATASDVDSADFDTGTLTVDFTANSTANDRLAIQNVGTGVGEIGISGANVTYEGTTIGSFAGGTDGSTPLVVTLGASADASAVQALLRNITYENVSEDPSTAARTVRFVLTDGDGGTSSAITETINVAAQNDDPAIALPAGALNYTEGDGTVVIDATVTASDVDSADFDTGTLTVDFTANGSANDRLAIQNVGTGVGEIGISGTDVTYEGTVIGSFAGGTDGTTPLVVTLNASADATAVQALMRNITYANVSEDPATAARTVRFVLTDGDSGTSTAVTETINVAGQNDDPVVGLPGGTVNYAASDPATVIDSGGTVTDVDSSDLDTGTLTIDFTANSTVNDRLAIQNVGTGLGEIGTSGSDVTYEGTVIGTFAGGTDGTTPLVVTLNASADATAVQELTRSITYENVSATPSAANRTVRFVLTDGDGGTSTPVTETIVVSSGNTAPTINLPGAPVNYTEGAGAVVIDATATASDVDAGDLDTGTLTVDFTAGGSTNDRLAIQNVGSGLGEIGTSGSDVSYEGAVIGSFAGGIDGTTPLVVTLNASSDATAAQELLRNITYENVSEDPSTVSRTVRFVLTDGDGGTSAAVTETINVAAQNDAPSIALPAVAVNYTEGDGAVVIDATAAASDVDSADFDTGSLTVDFTANSTANDRLSIQNVGTGVGEIGTSGTDVSYAGTTIGTFAGGSDGSTPLVVTLNASADATAVQALLRNIAYANVSEDPSSAARTVRFVVTDGDDGTSGAVTETVDVTAQNDDPSLALPASALNYTEGDGAVVIDATATASDVDSADFDTGSLTVDFTANSTADDRLSIQSVGAGMGEIGTSGTDVTYEGTIIGSFAGGSDGSTPLVVTLNASADAASVQALLQSITYANVSEDPSTAARTVRFVLTDGDSGTSTAATETINVAAQNDAPSLALPAGAVNYTEGDGAVVIDATATASDVDSADFDTGTLTVDFTANSTANDRLTIQNVGTGVGEIGTSGTDVSYAGTTIGTFAGGTDGTTPLVVTLNTSADATAVQALLRTITYESVSEDPSTAARTLRFVLTDGDGGTSSAATETVNVTAENDDPAIALPAGALNYTEGDGAVIIDATATASDVDSADFATGTLTVDFTANGSPDDRLSIQNVGTGLGEIGTSGTDVTYEGTIIGTFAGGTDGSTPLVVTLNASADAAAVQALMRTITYENVSEDPSTASRTVRFVLTDGDSGTSSAVTETINVAAQNDDPVIALPAGAVNYTEGDGGVVIDGTATASDVDSADFDTGALTVDFTAGGSANDRLAIQNVGTGLGEIGTSGTDVSYEGTIIGSFAGGTDGTTPLVVTLNASADATAVQALMRNITYANVSEDPSTAARTVRFVLTDGDGGASSAATETINVTAQNDDPAIALPAGAVNYTEGDGAVVIDATATASDVDSADFDAGTLTVDFTANSTANDRLTIQNVGAGVGEIGTSGTDVTYEGTIIGSFVGGTDGSTPLVVTLNASTDATAVQALLRNVTYANVSEDPSIAARTVRFVLTDGDGGTSTAVTETINVAAQNDEPSIALPAGTVNYTEGDSAVVIDATATLSDVDSVDFDTGTLTVDLTANGTADDRLSIRNVGSGLGEIGTSGTDVSYEGTTIGSFVGGTDGSTPLVVTLNASADATAAQALLQNITYANVSEDPSTAARTVRFVLTDGDGGTSTAVTETINVAAQNDDPAIGLPAGALNYTEGDGAVVIDATATASDADSVDFNTGTLTVDFTANGSADDRLSIQNVGTGLGEVGTSGTDVTYEGTTIGSFAGGTDGSTSLVVTLDASADATAVQALMRNITYANASEAPSILARTVRFVVTDGDGGTSTAVTETINVAAQNDDPSLALPAGVLHYTEGDGAVVIDATATASDVDSVDFDTGTLTVDFTANSTANDRLTIQNVGTGLGEIGTSGTDVNYEGTTIGSFAGGTDGSTPLVVTLNASADATAAQALLRNITYENVSDDPSTAARTVRFVLTDGDGGTSSAVTETINVTADNDAPVNTVPGPQTTTEDTPLVFSTAGGNRISLSDVDAGFSPLEISLTAADGTITLGGTTGLTFTTGDGTDDATMVFTGALVDANAALDGLTFDPTPDFTGLASLDIITSDQGHTGSGGAQLDSDTILINVTPPNAVPTLNTQSFAIDERVTVGSYVGVLSASDPDAGDELTFSITGGNVGDAFRIEASSGVITVQSSTALSSASVFNLTVEVEDSGVPALSDTATIFISVYGTPDPIPPQPAPPPVDEPPEVVPPTASPEPEEPPAADPAPEPEGPPASPPDDSISGDIAFDPVGAGSPRLTPGLPPITELAPPDTDIPVSEAPPELPSTLISRNVAPSSSGSLAVEARVLERPQSFEDTLAALEHEPLWYALDTMHADMDEAVQSETQRERLIIGTVQVTSLALTAGFVAWVLRAGALLTAFLSAVPLWARFDPLPVLALTKKERKQLESEVEQHEAEEEKELGHILEPPTPRATSETIEARSSEKVEMP